MRGAAEVELKLRLPRAALRALREHAALRAARHGRARREALDATYFDTPDLALARRGIALRVRKERGRWIQTAKGRGTTAGGLAQRAEEERDLGRGARRPAPDLRALADTPLGREIARASRGGTIGPVFATTFARTSLPLAFPDGTTALAAIDVGRARTVAGKRRSAAFCELELELRMGSVARLFELAARLAADLPLAVEPRSKAERGYALVAPVTPSPRHARAPEFDDAPSAAAAWSAVVRSALVQIEGNTDGVLHADDPEWIHQMRVGVRRLRSALALARPLADHEGRAGVEDEARWIARALGRPRDLDVFVGETLPGMRAALDGAATAAIDALAAAAEPQRAAARRDARAAVRSPRFQRLLLAIGALAAAPPAHTADVSAHDFARRALRRRHRRLLSAAESLDGAGPEARHGARIAAKKLRYAAEFFAPLYSARRVAPYTSALAEMQDVLGRLNDATAAVALAGTLVPPDAPAVTLMTGWAAGLAAGEERDLRRAWKRFRRARPFWKDATEE